ncbi:MAG TPA: IPT/TIG domain-containing protein, partial [Polyangiaceae bacterium]|nr:IPT/TIG domain-containing protein [Polyangiaceae bacterium]
MFQGRDRALVVLAASGLAFLGVAFVACIAGGPPIDPIADDGGGSSAGIGGSTGTFIDAPETPPHAVVGCTPSHGPFSGGQRVIVRGNGFTSGVRVWFGATEATDVVPIDATRVQVTAPAGPAGPVDVSAQNADDASTRRTLPGGYAYDALYAAPSTGPVAGGTEVSIFGQGTSWNASTKAFIDGKECPTLGVVAPTELTCIAPKGTPGSKTVRVDGGGDSLNVLDAYTYEDSSDGFKGGLSGSPLAGKLRVLVYDNFTGEAVPGASVVVGSNLATAIVEAVDDTGVVEITDPSLTAPVTVTVGGLCHSAITFVDEPVDTVTAYLDPIITPSCGVGGDPPGVGNKTGAVGVVRGELVFPSGVEFKRGPWTVPAPLNANEQRTAYIFPAAASAQQSFALPAITAAVTPESPGSIGYEFGFSSSPGNRTYYALAGIEDRTKSPPKFTAYAGGVVKGVPVLPNETVDEVYIQMVPFDLALTIDPSPPPPGSNGPDRLLTQLAIRLGNDGFALLPSGSKAPLLPLSGDVSFVGLPELGGAFLGSTYYVSSRAVTGESFLAPMSVVGSVQTTTTAFPV